MANINGVNRDKVLAGCLIRFMKYYYPKTQGYSKDTKSVGHALLRVEIVRITPTKKYTCRVVDVLDSTYAGSHKVGDEFLISGANLFRKAHAHTQGPRSITAFGELNPAQFRTAYID